MKMKKFFKNIILLATVLTCGCSTFDDSDLRDRIDGYKDRIEKLQQKAETLNSQIEALGSLTNGNVITDVSQDSDGKFVITYRDDSDQEYTVVLATMDDLLDVPVLGVALDEEEGIYYWTQTVDGQTTWLTKGEGGERIPVRGNTPVLSVDEQGYWTVDGERINDADGNPIEANDEESSLFREASFTDGTFSLTLANGEVITLQVFDTLNLKLQTTATVTIVDPDAGYRVAYDLTGEAADRAIVAIARECGGAKAALDTEAKRIDVTFDASFSADSGAHIIVMAYDLDQNVVIKPVFFTMAADSRITIATKEQLRQFATDVNAGAIPAGMQVLLTQDIDMAGVNDWVPIGNASFDGTNVSGATFSGTFDGQGYAIRNLAVKSDAAAENGAFGLFGVVENATIRNLTIDEGSSFDLKNTGFLSVGAVAGVAVGGSSFEGCENHASITVEATLDAKRIEAGGIVGGTYASENDITFEKCSNFGRMKSLNTVDKNNGANGIQLAGILGFANGSSDGTGYTRIIGCENNGDIEAQAARAGGLVGAMNYRGAISSSTNNAAVTNTEVTASNCRTGGLAGFMTNNSTIESSTNNGDVTFAVAGDTTHGYVAGIVSQMQVANTSVIGCANYGAIRSDIIKAETNRYIAIICSNTNKTACVLRDNRIGGKIGPYTEDETYKVTDITADNYADYIFFHLEGTDPTLENNIFAGDAPVGKGIASVDDLKAFAAAVNAGESTEAWQDDQGVVNLLADLDMSGVTEWTPIGNATISAASNVSSITVNAGYPFTGVFDGGGHVIRNLKLSTESTAAEHVFGLFGMVRGAEIRNLQIGDETTADNSSLTVTTPTSVWAGTLAGVAVDSRISDCTSYADVTYDSTTASSSRAFIGGMVGCCFSDETETYLDQLKNYGAISADAHGNTNNGLSSAPHIGGVCALTSANSTNKKINHVEYCANYGDIVSNTARTAGIIGAANSYTAFNSCSNYGNQTNSVGDTGRLGAITVILGTGSSMIDCENYGDLVSTNGARVGGIVSLPNNATNTFSGCANYGKIISDAAYRGVFFGYNGVASTWVNCTAGGQVGVYNGGNYIFDSYTDDMKELYLGPQGTNKAQLSNIVYQIGTDEGETPTGPEPTLRILCIGNSFTKDAVEHLPKMIAAAGIETVKIMHMYYGGRTVPEYFEGYDTTNDYTCYMLNTGTDVWTSFRGMTLKQAAASDKWDIVTIQEHTGNYRAWSWTAEEKAAITGLIDCIKADQGDNIPEFKYIMSQAYFDMNKIGTGSRPYMTFSTQDEMFDVIVAQAKKVLAETEIDEVIPTGTVLQNLRTSSLNNEMDLTRDGYHMDYGISRYAAACAVFEMLISPAFDGVTLDDNSFRYDVTSTATGSYTTPVTDTNRLIALQAARYAMAKPFEVTDMSAPQNIPDNGIGDMPFENDTDKE